MLIDWFTVIAQIINFLILVWLMKRFLYKPILQAIDEREKRITSQLQEAETKEKEAQNDRDKYQRLHETLEQQKTALLEKAETEAGAERQRLLESARTEYNQLRSRLQESLKNEQSNLSQGIISRTQKEIFEIANKVLADLAGTSLEEQIARVFVGRIKAMQQSDREAFSKLLSESGHKVVVQSAFNLTPETRDSIKQAIAETIGHDIPVEFLTDPEKTAGIELFTDGYKIAWTITDYLTALEESISKLPEASEPVSKRVQHGV